MRAVGCNSFGYVATGDLATRRMGSPQVTGWLRAEIERLGFDAFLGIIPAARQLAQAFGSIVVTTRVDRDGFTVVS
jgi:hypothetical protein